MMNEIVQALCDWINSPQPPLANLAAVAGILGFLIVWWARRRLPPDVPRVYRASRLWRTLPVPFSVLRTFRITKGTADRARIVQYLDTFVRAMNQSLREKPVDSWLWTLPQFPALVQRASRPPRLSIDPIRQALKLLSGLYHGGDRASAQLASLSRRGRFVRSALRTLIGTTEPLILLGDPGSGKSYTLRRVAVDLANWEKNRPDPKVVVFVPLSRYTSEFAGTPGTAGSVRQLISESVLRLDKLLPAELSRLMGEERLIVIFDGMDEMPRGIYSDRVRRLSSYARFNSGRVKTVFSCRINDFAPEFLHRQMVLLPFDHANVTDYLSENLDLPIRIAGIKYTRGSAVANAILERPELAELATNPQMLSLIAGYILTKKEWPATRAQLFNAYVEELYRAKTMDKVPPAAAPTEFYDACARMAYLSTRDQGGVTGDTTILRKEWGQERLDEVVTRAVECGLLLRDPERPERVTFAHHRLQEYLTARYLAAHGEKGIPWRKWLEHPRWQEVLVHLCSIAPRTPGLRALGDSLALDLYPPLSHETRKRNGAFPLDNETETRLADLLVLASEVIREATGSSTLPARLMDHFRTALRAVATYGRPMSQVKVLWCWKNAPDEDSIDALAVPLRSGIHWVRSQAVTVIFATAKYRTRLASELSYEIGVDLVSGNILSRFGVYWKAVRRLRSWRRAFVLAWGIVLRCSYFAALAVLAGCSAVLAIRHFPFALSGGVEIRSIALGGIMVLLGGVMTRYGILVPQALLYSAIVVGGLAWSGGLLIDEGVMSGVVGVWMTGAGLLGAVAVGAAVYWLTVALYIGIVRPKEGSVGSRGSLFLLAWNRPDEMGEVVIRAIAIQVTLIGLVLGLLDASMGWLRENFPMVVLGMGVVVWCTVALSFVGPAWRAAGAIGGLFAFMGMAAALWLGRQVVQVVEQWLSYENVRFVIVGAVGAGILVALFTIALRWFRQRVAWRRQEALTVEEWMQRMMRVDAKTQARELTMSARHALGVSASEYLRLLRELEGSLDVLKEPVASPYWQLRHELEQGLRQDELGLAEERPEGA